MNCILSLKYSTTTCYIFNFVNGFEILSGELILVRVCKLSKLIFHIKLCRSQTIISQFTRVFGHFKTILCQDIGTWNVHREITYQ